MPEMGRLQVPILGSPVRFHCWAPEQVPSDPGFLSDHASSIVHHKFHHLSLALPTSSTARFAGPSSPGAVVSTVASYIQVFVFFLGGVVGYVLSVFSLRMSKNLFRQSREQQGLKPWLNEVPTMGFEPTSA